ncbi:MAG: hypothetical protein ACOH5I_00305 [Oligoflexus sp.]
MAKQFVMAACAALLLISCGSDEETRTQPGQQEGFSLISQSPQEMTLRFEIYSLFRNIALKGMRNSCEERLAATENPDAYQYAGYEYQGNQRRCARRNVFKQCEVQEYIHSIDCRFNRSEAE